MGTWKKAENENGFIYYISDHQSLQQWDHPKFCDVKQAIDDCNHVIYATYRLALKFRVLQRALYTEDIPLALSSAIFQRHRLANNENSLVLETCDLEAVLADIFFAANNQNHMNIDVDFVAEMVINLLYNVFDNFRQGTIQVLSVKLTLGLLCNSSPPELRRYLFSLCADHNNCITRVRLFGLLQKMHLLMKYLHEDQVFSAHSLSAAVDQCFADSCPKRLLRDLPWHSPNSPKSMSHTSPSLSLERPRDLGCPETEMRLLGLALFCFHSFKIRCIKRVRKIQSPGLVGIAEGTFTSWLNSDVPFLSWLPLVAKLKGSETVIHPLKCSTCKTTPLLGLRYSCAKCPKYLQCQRCFLTGRTSHSHKLSHSLREYCSLLSKQDAFRMVLHGLCGWVFCAKRPNDFYSMVKPCRHFANEGLKPFMVVDIEPLSSPETQLQGVIRQLESQNRELQQMLIFGRQGDKEMRTYLEEYRLSMAGNIQKLKKLKVQINTAGSASKENRSNLARTQSTPLACQPNPAKYKKASLETVSPLTVMTEIEDSLSSGSNSQFFTPMEFPDVDVPKLRRKLSHHNLDEALAKLQQILANNFLLEDSLSQLDNSNLQFAVTEVEGMLTSIIDNVESNSEIRR